METAYLIFKDHKNFQNIKVLVVPNLREECDSLKGIPGDTGSILEEYRKLFPKFDTSLLRLDKMPKDKLWIMEDKPEI